MAKRGSSRCLYLIYCWDHTKPSFQCQASQLDVVLVTSLLFVHNTAERKHCGWVWPSKGVKEQWSMMNPWTQSFLFRGAGASNTCCMLYWWVSGVNRIKCKAHLHFSTFSCQSGLAPLLTNRTGWNQMVCASCFHLKPLFENRVIDRMWGKTQVPVSSPLNVPFMPRHCWASPESPLHWCGCYEKKHNGRSQFTFEQWRCTNLGNRRGLMTCAVLFPADFPVPQLVENLNTASFRLT